MKGKVTDEGGKTKTLGELLHPLAVGEGEGENKEIGVLSGIKFHATFASDMVLCLLILDLSRSVEVVDIAFNNAVRHMKGVLGPAFRHVWFVVQGNDKVNRRNLQAQYYFPRDCDGSEDGVGESNYKSSEALDIATKRLD